MLSTIYKTLISMQHIPTACSRLGRVDAFHGGGLGGPLLRGGEQRCTGHPLSNYAPPTAQGLILLLVPNLWEARQKQNCHQTTGSAAAKATSEEPRRFHALLEENIQLRTHSRPVTWAHNADYPPPQQSLQGPPCRWPSTLAPRPHLPGGGRKLTFYF